MKGSSIRFQNDGLTFGSLLRGPHIPLIGLQASSLHHLVEKLCHCFTVSVNSLVAKWRRSADGFLWLSSPPSRLCSTHRALPLWATRGRAGASFLCIPQLVSQKEEKVFPSWLFWTRCSLGKHPCSLRPSE